MAKAYKTRLKVAQECSGNEWNGMRCGRGDDGQGGDGDVWCGFGGMRWMAIHREAAMPEKRRGERESRDVNDGGQCRYYYYST